MEQNHIDPMMESSHRCEKCGGTMAFDPAGCDLVCARCENRRGIPQTGAPGAATAGEQDLSSAEATGNRDWGVAKKTVRCKNCGAETVCDAPAVPDACPYCGQTQSMETVAAETLAPGGVCPFEVPRAAAASEWYAYLKKQWFCPSKVKMTAKPEALRGLYLPCWAFDAAARSHYSAQFGIDRCERGRDGKERTVTDWYPTSGTFSESFDGRFVWGTGRIDRLLLSGILPFSAEKSRAYRPEYLAGFAVERYSVGLTAAWETAKEELSSKLIADIRAKILFDRNAHRVRDLAVKTAYDGIAYQYLLLPVWSSSLAYRGKSYRFLVNGQTGKVAGKTPVSVWRVLMVALAAAAAVAGVAWWIAAK